MEIRKNLKNIAFLLSSEIAIKGVLFVTNIIIARQLSLDAYGVISNAILLTQNIGNASDFGMSRMITRDIANGKLSIKTAIQNYFGSKNFLNILGIISIFIATEFIDSKNWLAYILFGAYSILQYSILSYLYAIIRGKKLFILESRNKGLGLLGNLVGLIIFYISPNIVTAALVYLLATIPPLTSLIVYLIREHDLQFRYFTVIRLHVNRLKDNFIVGLGYLIEGLYLIIPLQIVKIAFGNEPVAIFSAAFRLITPITLIGVVFNSMLFPNQAQNSGKVDLSRNKRIIITILISIYLLTVWMLSHPIIALIYGNQYGDASIVLVALAAYPIFEFMCQYYSNAILSINKEKSFLISSILTVLSSLIIYSVLVNFYNLSSPLVLALTYTLSRLLSLVIKYKIYKEKYGENNN